MKNYKTSLLVTAVAVAGFAQVSPAPPSFPALPGLYLYDTATGASGLGTLTAPGIWNFSGSVGDYSVAISTGITGGSSTQPLLDLDIADASTSTAGDSLLVFFSNGTFGPTSGGYILSTTGPSSGGGSAFTSAFLGSTPFSQTTALGGSADVFPLTINASGGLSANNYYLTVETAITGTVVSLDSSLSVVPETTTVVAAALMLLPLGIGAVRSLRKEQAA